MSGCNGCYTLLLVGWVNASCGGDQQVRAWSACDGRSPRKEQMRGVMELWRYKVYTPQKSSRKISLLGGQVELIRAADLGGA